MESAENGTVLKINYHHHLRDDDDNNNIILVHLLSITHPSA